MLISTIIIVLMASWIIITIQKVCKRSITSLSLTCWQLIQYVLIRSAVSTTLVIGYVTGRGNLLLSCSHLLHNYVTISVEKLIAITFPLRYHQLMKPQVVFGIITIKWIVAVLFNPNGFTHTAKFCTCIPNGKSHMFTHIIAYYQ